MEAKDPMMSITQNEHNRTLGETASVPLGMLGGDLAVARGVRVARGVVGRLYNGSASKRGTLFRSLHPFEKVWKLNCKVQPKQRMFCMGIQIASPLELGLFGQGNHCRTGFLSKLA
jgi:hypothetical protein